MTEEEILQAVNWWLDYELDFGLDYEASIVHDTDGSILIYKINTKESDVWGVSWERRLELLVMRIVLELDAWFSWKGQIIGLHLHFNTQNNIVLLFFRIYRVCLSIQGICCSHGLTSHNIYTSNQNKLYNE